MDPSRKVKKPRSQGRWKCYLLHEVCYLLPLISDDCFKVCSEMTAIYHIERLITFQKEGKLSALFIDSLLVGLCVAVYEL
jgi:hypothetical protein